MRHLVIGYDPDEQQCWTGDVAASTLAQLDDKLRRLFAQDGPAADFQYVTAFSTNELLGIVGQMVTGSNLQHEVWREPRP